MHTQYHPGFAAQEACFHGASGDSGAFGAKFSDELQLTVEGAFHLVPRLSPCARRAPQIVQETELTAGVLNPSYVKAVTLPEFGLEVRE